MHEWASVVSSQKGPGPGVVSIVADFHRVFVTLTAPELAAPGLLPVRLAKACPAALPVAGAGLSAFTHDGFRIPLGASDDTALTAERFQFTVGQGPCIEAHASARPVLAPDAVLGFRWPLFHQQLVSLRSRCQSSSPVSVPSTCT